MKIIIRFLSILLVLSIFSCVASAQNGGRQSVEGNSSSTSAKSATVHNVDEIDIAIRDASDYLNENIPRGSKIVILNIQSNSSDLSDYIIDELIANAVNDKVFTVVDRQQLDALRSEQNFQLSGEVDDKDALAIGKFFGAHTIVSGAVNRLGTGYRIRIRALEVQTAQVQGQYNRNIASSQTINSLLASSNSPTNGSTTNATSRTSGSSTTVSGTTSGGGATTSTSADEVTVPLTVGTTVPGNNLAEKLAWLQRSAESHNTYILEVNTDENIAPQTLEYKGAINITIAIRGDNQNRTIRLRSNGTMFTVRTNVTFVLENNIILHGHNGNTGYMVHVNKGTFKMNSGSTISGNAKCGVYVDGGTFDMNGGNISGNGNSKDDGGGVFAGGAFTMNGGNISNNTASSGGGVYVCNNFRMRGGNIFGNKASRGGGVSIYYSTLHGNGHFTMSGGTITGNTAGEYGGGVYDNGIYYIFTKTGGTITGYNSDQNNGNAVKDDAGAIARRGHAVWVSENRRKETTAGQGVTLSNSSNTGWDN